MPTGNDMPGTETRLTDDAISAHHPRDGDAFARREPPRPAPMPAGAVLLPGTGRDMPVTLPAADSLVGSITGVASITRQRKTPPRATSRDTDVSNFRLTPAPDRRFGRHLGGARWPGRCTICAADAARLLPRTTARRSVDEEKACRDHCAGRA